MKRVGRILVALLCALCAFVVAFLIGFYMSFLFGANLHDIWPGVSGLAFGLVGAIIGFSAITKRTASQKLD